MTVFRQASLVPADETENRKKKPRHVGHSRDSRRLVLPVRGGELRPLLCIAVPVSTKPHFPRRHLDRQPYHCCPFPPLTRELFCKLFIDNDLSPMFQVQATFCFAPSMSWY